MAAKIFINYRRDDAKAEAARLRDRLAQAFGAANVFMDVDNLQPGERFDIKLQQSLSETDVFLSVIGGRWTELLAARAKSGERDHVCEEIAAALAHRKIVIPVLLDRAALPRAADLPGDIAELVLHQKHDVVHESFGRDAAALIEAIKAARGGRGANRPGCRGSPLRRRWRSSRRARPLMFCCLSHRSSQPIRRRPKRRKSRLLRQSRRPCPRRRPGKPATACSWP